jgi:hypothetical protein
LTSELPKGTNIMPNAVKGEPPVDAVASSTARLIYVGAAVAIVGSVFLWDCQEFCA